MLPNACEASFLGQPHRDPIGLDMRRDGGKEATALMILSSLELVFPFRENVFTVAGSNYVFTVSDLDYDVWTAIIGSKFLIHCKIWGS